MNDIETSPKTTVETLAKLGGATSRRFRDRSRHDRVQLALRKQQLASVSRLAEKNETAI
jgi:hypothetical protein